MKKMTEAQATKRSKARFNRLLDNPKKSGSARVILARRINRADPMDQKDILRRAKSSAGKHAQQARKALVLIEPASSLD